jgi:hypothetical protein
MVMWMLPVMRAPCERLALAEFLADGHQAGHFGFGDPDFLAAPGGKRKVGDGGVHGGLQSTFRKSH